MNRVDWLRHASIFFATIGQIGFVGLWMTRRWWVHWVTRAVMMKSATLLLLLLLASVHYLTQYFSDVPPWKEPSGSADGWDRAEVLCYWLVAAAIWGQFIALILQVHRDDLQEKDIVQAETDQHR